MQRDDIGIRLADGHDNIDQVGMLVTRMYRRRGYLVPVSEASPSDWIRRVTLEACYKNRTVGTLTVNLGSREGLQAEALYGEEIVEFRRAGARPCEFTRLALDAEECSKEALACLFHLGYIFAYRIHRASDVFVEVNPRHALFYRRKLGFAQIGAQKVCPRVNAPAVLLHKRLDVVAAELARLGGMRTPENKSFYALGLSPAEESGLVRTIEHLLAESGLALDARAQGRDEPRHAIADLAHSA
ncbi:MAG: N-acyl amino acid synthase FeeM domain-containing protein [Burkholderiales bacterium]